jgi:threonine/homoserine/homoserine lactone efflux protein
VAKPLRTSIVSAARPVIKWGGLAFTAWEAYRVWQQVRRQRGTSASQPTRDRSDEDDLTG